MRRLDTFTIIIIAVCLVAAGLLIWVGYQKLSGDDAQDDKSALYEEIEKNDDYYYLDEEEEDDTAQDGFANTEDAQIDDPQNTSTYDNTDYEEVEEQPSTAGKIEDSVPSSYSSDGAYMVLAGSFKVRAYADSHAKNLRDKGYSNTSVERFDKGTYAVVMVDRFNTLNEAKSLVSRLKNDGIDSFVKKK